jgi:hypothetical protein
VLCGRVRWQTPVLALVNVKQECSLTSGLRLRVNSMTHWWDPGSRAGHASES